MAVKIQDLIDSLNQKDEFFFKSHGEYENRVHILHKKANLVKVPSKSDSEKYNKCKVAFAHLYEDKDNSKLFWLKKANHSGTVIGHNCIISIFDNLSSPETFISDTGKKEAAKEVLESDIPKIIEELNEISISINNLNIDDVNYQS